MMNNVNFSFFLIQAVHYVKEDISSQEGEDPVEFSSKFLAEINGNIKSVNKVLLFIGCSDHSFFLFLSRTNPVLQQVVIVSLTMKKSNDIPNCKSSKQSRSIDQQCIEIQDKTSSIKHDQKKHEDIEEMLRDFMQTRVLETVYEDEESSWERSMILNSKVKIFSRHNQSPRNDLLIN
ncbi:hypothetical protein OIU85_027547 [Salix viminalis]|uniref:Uncharacterized protein n=1 Tax=Salix viminalis TaxID=40686 RepID=A0A9Q0QIK6_SALVM|nr:hypothetical protein OIU85_027547 [Salix viminalis]